MNTPTPAKLATAVQSFIDIHDARMLVRLVRKYPESARVPLKDRSSLLARALEAPEAHWPILMAYAQGGGGFDGAGPTRGDGAVKNWIDCAVPFESLAEPSRYASAKTVLAFLAESGAHCDEQPPGRLLCRLLEADLRYGAPAEDGLFALGLDLELRAGSGRYNPIIAFARHAGAQTLTPEPIQAVIARARGAGADLHDTSEEGLTAMDCAVGHKNVAFIIALAREGAPMPLVAIRTNGFELADMSRLEAESLRLRTHEMVEADDAPRPAFARRSVL